MSAEPGPAFVDGDAMEVRRTVLIRASRQRVWDALTIPEQVASWFGQTAHIDELVVGGTGSFGWEGYGEFPIVIREVEPLSVFALTWGTPGEPIREDNSSTMRFTLEEAPAGTLLTVVETGFGAHSDPAASMEDNRQGWDSELDQLVAFVEGSA